MIHGFVIFITATVTWLVSSFALHSLDYSLNPNLLLISATLSALYATGMVVMTENLLEDMVKVLLLIVPAGIAAAVEPRLSFLLLCALSASGLGVLFNSLSKMLAKSKTAAS